MLLLTFQAGESTYAVEGRGVVEVVPRVRLRPIPHAPAGLLGLLSYRGEVVPVVDFAAVAGAPPGADSLSTRIILTEFEAPDGSNTKRRLGVLAAGVNDVVRSEAGRLVLTDMRLDEAPYLGPVYRLDDQLIQVVRPEALLAAPVQAALYGGAPGGPA